jgi:hypothetical protein
MPTLRRGVTPDFPGLVCIGHATDSGHSIHVLSTVTLSVRLKGRGDRDSVEALLFRASTLSLSPQPYKPLKFTVPRY